MFIDTKFNFYSDSKGGDPDLVSPTLKRYHQILWSKTLPNGKNFTLENKKGSYLYHNSELGEFFLGSDAISYSYKNQKRKSWLICQVPNEAEELFKAISCIGSYIIFPNKQINRKNTINQERGFNKLIDDRFDLTLECIRLFYLGKVNPLYDVFNRYKDFFNLFVDFNGYINFFLLQDLIENGDIKFYLPFDKFKKPHSFLSIDEYLTYKANVIHFVKSRNKRIKDYEKALNKKTIKIPHL